MNLKNTIFLAAALCFLCLSQAMAQIQIFSKNALDKIKDGTTHVMVGDADFPNSAEYYRVFKKYWTVTKGVEFLKESDLKENIKEGDSYFRLENVVIHNYYMGRYPAQFFYLNLWIPSDRGVKKPGKFSIYNETAIAHLQTSVRYLKGDSHILTFDFDGSGHISNWNPGTLKNYLQRLSTALQKGEKMNTDDITNKDELKLLRSQVLYCPEDDFITMNMFGKLGTYTDDEIADLFKSYQFQYKTITNRELEDKILADKEPFYYMLYFRGLSVGIMIGVVNSRTGELIYSKTKSSTYNSMKSGEIKDLYKAVNKD
ncbi:MAG: hypothetical protein JWP94_922 [Mucilaginibacter sp.]|jgi:hypothetical protein|nr:hypothetical protein [Mucilaginibacter sp.]